MPEPGSTQASSIQAGSIKRGSTDEEQAGGRKKARRRSHNKSKPSALGWYYAQHESADGEEILRVAKHRDDGFFTLIWSISGKYAHTGISDQTRAHRLTLNEWEEDCSTPSFKPVKLEGMNWKQEIERTRDLKDLLHSALGGRSWLDLKSHPLEEYLEQLQVKEDDSTAARLNDLIFQASNGTISIRGVKESQWWAKRHPPPTAPPTAESFPRANLFSNFDPELAAHEKAYDDHRAEFGP